MKNTTCEICGKVFLVKPYRMKSARFCSHACGGKWHMANRVMRGPSLAGNTLRVGIAPSNKGEPSAMKGRKLVLHESFECAFCKIRFQIAPWLARQNKTVSGKRFCSKSCHSEYRKIYESGKNSPAWVGGPATYRGRGWMTARLIAVNRDGGICQDCGKHIGNSIPVHHVRPFRFFDSSAEANHPDNLLCLCPPCHMKAEKVATVRV